MQMKRHADAEDVAQEVFVRLLKYEPQFENKEHEKAWFVKATVNLCRDIMKSKWNSTTVSIEKIPEQERRRNFVGSVGIARKVPGLPLFFLL